MGFDIGSFALRIGDIGPPTSVAETDRFGCVTTAHAGAAA